MKEWKAVSGSAFAEPSARRMERRGVGMGVPVKVMRGVVLAEAFPLR